jgi:hypothetical protein
VRLATDGDLQIASFVDLESQAQYLDSPHEGRALRISAKNAENDQELTAQLYQLRRDHRPDNQFLGSHGFTGLVYVYHPSSQAEIQYICESN